MQLCGKYSLKYFCSVFLKNLTWYRNRDVFESRHKEWLDAIVKLQIQKEAALPAEAVAGPSGVRRPKKSFVDSNEHSKLSIVSPLVQQNTEEELFLATRVSLYKSGRRNAARILRDLSASPTRAAKIKKTVLSCKNCSGLYTKRSFGSLC
ncbi:unnamed protein product [Psylliodes chrysocephalus]|uniref:Uncharacterized protein n=1 Tax=Psylliodes chrysocephalus TaxID=3402493 RepID=A0A9P0CDR2_9CUCU|nr:unnamed protein product [Psylliodes chrysocephala]